MNKIQLIYFTKLNMKTTINSWYFQEIGFGLFNHEFITCDIKGSYYV